MNRDHQVIYGRRGTGKTHALQYLSDCVNQKGDFSIYIDLRAHGSNTSVYSDTSKSISERATCLLLDVLRAMHDDLLAIAVDRAEEFDLSQTGPILDRLADAISEVKVIGTVTQEATTVEQRETRDGANLGVTARAEGNVGFDIGLSTLETQQVKAGIRTVVSGVARYRIQFGATVDALSKLIAEFGNKRVWILMDEWSAVPFELQPYLADLLRRCVFPVQNITVKIAAIEQRSRFQLPGDHGDYIGIELGADAAADLNLDDFMVFDNDAERAKAFFKDLLYKHYRATEDLSPDDGPQSPDELIQCAFTQVTAFDELVRAVEGVPRDAINIVALAAQRAYGTNISVSHIRTAARDWYHRDKSDSIKSNDKALSLLNWIIDEVIGERRARAFLLKSSEKHDLVDALFDARLLHILKRNISARDQPGVRYDVYKLDFGCYVDLIATARAPQGFLPLDPEDGEAGFAEVPPDDYRSIRRAILDLNRFEEAYKTS